MHPEVNRFISEVIYESRLKTGPENHRQVVHVPEGYDGLLTKEAGIIYVPVKHEGNSQASEEEATVIAGLTQQLLGRTLVDIKGYSHILGWEHILFVAPYIAVGACVEYKTLVAGASSNHIAVSHASGYRYNYQVNVLQSALGGTR